MSGISPKPWKERRRKHGTSPMKKRGHHPHNGTSLPSPPTSPLPPSAATIEDPLEGSSFLLGQPMVVTRSLSVGELGDVEDVEEKEESRKEKEKKEEKPSRRKSRLFGDKKIDSDKEKDKDKDKDREGGTGEGKGKGKKEKKDKEKEKEKKEKYKTKKFKGKMDDSMDGSLGGSQKVFGDGEEEKRGVRWGAVPSSPNSEQIDQQLPKKRSFGSFGDDLRKSFGVSIQGDVKGVAIIRSLARAVHTQARVLSEVGVETLANLLSQIETRDVALATLANLILYPTNVSTLIEDPHVLSLLKGVISFDDHWAQFPSLIQFVAGHFVFLARKVFEELHSDPSLSSPSPSTCSLTVEEMLVKVGEKMGKKGEDVAPFVTILEENWYDSVEALRKVTLEDLIGMKIPRRFAVMLLEEVKSSNRSSGILPHRMDSNFHPPNELDQETAYLTPDGEFLREHLKAQYLIIFANSIDCSVQFVEIAYWVMRQPELRPIILDSNQEEVDTIVQNLCSLFLLSPHPPSLSPPPSSRDFVSIPSPSPGLKLGPEPSSPNSSQDLYEPISLPSSSMHTPNHPTPPPNSPNSSTLSSPALSPSSPFRATSPPALSPPNSPTLNGVLGGVGRGGGGRGGQFSLRLCHLALQVLIEFAQLGVVRFGDDHVVPSCARVLRGLEIYPLYPVRSQCVRLLSILLSVRLSGGVAGQPGSDVTIRYLSSTFQLHALFSSLSQILCRNAPLFVNCWRNLAVTKERGKGHLMMPLYGMSGVEPGEEDEEVLVEMRACLEVMTILYIALNRLGGEDEGAKDKKVEKKRGRGATQKAGGLGDVRFNLSAVVMAPNVAEPGLKLENYQVMEEELPPETCNTLSSPSSPRSPLSPLSPSASPRSLVFPPKEVPASMSAPMTSPRVIPSPRLVASPPGAPSASSPLLVPKANPPTPSSPSLSPASTSSLPSLLPNPPYSPPLPASTQNHRKADSFSLSLDFDPSPPSPTNLVPKNFPSSDSSAPNLAHSRHPSDISSKKSRRGTEGGDSLPQTQKIASHLARSLPHSPPKRNSQPQLQLQSQPQPQLQSQPQLQLQSQTQPQLQSQPLHPTQPSPSPSPLNLPSSRQAQLRIHAGAKGFLEFVEKDEKKTNAKGFLEFVGDQKGPAPRDSVSDKVSRLEICDKLIRALGSLIDTADPQTATLACYLIYVACRSATEQENLLMVPLFFRISECLSLLSGDLVKLVLPVLVRLVPLVANSQTRFRLRIRDSDFKIPETSLAVLFKTLNDTSAPTWERYSAGLVLANVANLSNIQPLIAAMANLETLRNLADFGLIATLNRQIRKDDLKILKEIGRGAVGVVYEACWEGRRVAVKLFEESSIAFDMTEFRLEVALMTVLEHPRIVGAYGASLTSPDLFVVSKFFQGNLDERLYSGNKEKMSLSQVCSVACDIADAMSYLHDSGVVHRDLKPQNILIDEEDRASVCDFGNARFQGHKTQDFGGTLMYSAPEILQNSTNHRKGHIWTKAADVYSFGILFWELIHHDRPFQTKDGIYANLVERILKGERMNFGEEVPGDIAQLVRECWDPNPEERPTFLDVFLKLRVFVEREEKLVECKKKRRYSWMKRSNSASSVVSLVKSSSKDLDKLVK